MKTYIQGSHRRWGWECMHELWCAVNRKPYTRRRDAVRGLNRFIQRVSAK